MGLNLVCQFCSENLYIQRRFTSPGRSPFDFSLCSTRWLAWSSFSAPTERKPWRRKPYWKWSLTLSVWSGRDSQNGLCFHQRRGNLLKEKQLILKDHVTEWWTGFWEPEWLGFSSRIPHSHASGLNSQGPLHLHDEMRPLSVVQADRAHAFRAFSSGPDMPSAPRLKTIAK